MEKQAEERVHRLGQVNQVNIYRFSIANSVETWINGLKKKKMFTANILDLSYKHDHVPVDFSFSDISDLFVDLVGFKRGEQKDETTKKIVKDDVLVIGIDCSICLDDVGSSKPCNLGCGHVFHLDCIIKWKDVNDSCPMCIRPIRIM
jgi:hypothetical protein